MDEEKVCRYCFDGEESGQLISPCKCAGGQKWVHLACLRQWQRMVLVSQPTHPAFHDTDFRHQKCNVCKAEFTCPPPTRHELMESFTGPEIAALIDSGCVIAAHSAFSEELERQLQTMHPIMRHRSSYENWIRGVYLITEVTEMDGKQTVDIPRPEFLDRFRTRLDDDLSLVLHGKKYILAAGGSLEGTREDRMKEAFRQLNAPCSLVLALADPITCGDDHVVAVNLTRPISPVRGHEVEKAIETVCTKYRGARQVEITHFCGGPCDEDEIMSCIVLGGTGRGWTVCKTLSSAIELAYSRAVKRYEAQGDVCGGQTVRLKGLVACPELNGEMGIALRFVEESGRWLVRLCNGDGKQLKPANLEPLEGSTGRVFVAWGDARWSRAQLLGEIAKGDWGLCKANVGDLFRSAENRWPSMDGRLAFAPITSMSENYMREAMQAARVRVERNLEPADTGEEL
eukprot:TRINITY_DN42070_c0_g1_i1.p1 TRINITY_DN42070_c0_g1~~TRINITY_DN42070_c0_g1_i1.p1  ORF type:complete len:457 (+),score=86.47 TRINITY_DN42070_c0_g1_i1:114-1484(+)